MTKPDYIAIAKQYVDDVLGGRVPACRYVKAACQRQRDDLKRWTSENDPFWFDETAAIRPCWFIENLTHTKGELAGRNIHLEPWQVFLITTVFGWKTSQGNRRFRHAYIEVPRGNGKSTLLSGIGLFCLCADREPGAEVYSFATTREQAKIVFGDAQTMARGNKPLRDAFGLEVLAHALYIGKTNSTFQAKSAEGSTLDGLNTHLAIIDELHAHKRRDVFDVVETSLGKRRNSLLWSITTAGTDRSGICYEQRTVVTKILDKSIKDDSYFGIIYTIDADDDWKTDTALSKANPNWGVSVRPEVLKSLLAKAIATPSAENNFKTKHLDVWCNADESWMNMEKWDRLGNSDLSLSDFEGTDAECVIGLDLANKRDICAKVRLFRRYLDGRPHYYVFGNYFLPQDTVETASNSQYEGWHSLGHLTATAGAITNYAAIEDSIREDLSRFNVSAVAYDPWQATQLATALADEGAPMVEVRQTVQNLSEPMKTLEALVLDGRLHHDGNPCLAWMISNVVAHLDIKENIYPRKQRPENKIDGAVALIIALSRFVSGEQNYVGNFDEFLENMAVI